MKTFTSKLAIQNAIREQITTKDAQAIKALLRIFEFQTFNEQNSKSVISRNNVGFTVDDATFLTNLVKRYNAKHYLTEYQMNVLKRKIGKYAGQLLRLAIYKGLYVKEGKLWKVVNS